MTDKKKIIAWLADTELYYRERQNATEDDLHNSYMASETIELIKRMENNTCENCAAAIEDRQPVVRCKDCKRGVYEKENGFHPHVWCRGQCHPDYWFCADGERK